LDFVEGKLEKRAVCHEEATWEDELRGILSDIHDKMGDTRMGELNKYSHCNLVSTVHILALCLSTRVPP